MSSSSRVVVKLSKSNRGGNKSRSSSGPTKVKQKTLIKAFDDDTDDDNDENDDENDDDNLSFLNLNSNNCNKKDYNKSNKRDTSNKMEGGNKQDVDNGKGNKRR